MRRFGGIGVAWFVATVVAVTIAAAAVGSVRSEVTDVPTALGVSVSPEITAVTTDQLPNALDEGPDLARTSTSTQGPIVETAMTETAAFETSTTTTQPPTTTQPAVTERTDDTGGAAPREEAVKSRPQGTSDSSSTSTSSTPSAQPTSTTTTRVATTVTTTTRPATTVTTTTRPTTTTTTTTRPVSTAYTRIIDTEGGTLSVRVDGDDVEFRRAFPNSGWRFGLGNPGPEIVEALFGSIDDRSARIRVLVTVINGELDVSVTSSN